VFFFELAQRFSEVLSFAFRAIVYEKKDIVHVFAAAAWLLLFAREKRDTHLFIYQRICVYDLRDCYMI